MGGAHEGWGLWIQAPLLLGSFVASRRLLAGLRPYWLLVVGLLAPLVALWLLPAGRYHASGHEGVYFELLAGALPADPSDLRSYRVMPLPSGVTWMLGKLLPTTLAEWIWLAANRADLGLSVVVAGATAWTMQRNHVAPVWTVGLLLMTPALWGWSATGFAILPAVSASAFALYAGARGQGALALLWAGMALASRLEYLPVACTALALVPARAWAEEDRRHLAAAAAVAVVQVLLVATKGESLPADLSSFDALLAWRNFESLTLMEPFGRGVWVFVLLGFGAAAWTREPERALVAGGLALALLETATVVDLGARHFLPAWLLLAVLIGGGMADERWPWAHAAFVAVGGLYVYGYGLGELRARYMTGPDAVPPIWQCDDCTAPWAETEDSPCLRVFPGGSVDPGAADAALVAADRLDEGGCVIWAVFDHMEFSGDARGERTERAIRLLGLRPLGYASRPGEDPWFVMGAGLGAPEAVRP